MLNKKRLLVSLITLVAVTAIVSLVYADLAPGTKAPDFSLPTLDGKTFKLSSSFEKPAKPVVLDIWATWCGPCKRAIPYLVDLHNDYKDKAVFVGVSVDTDKEALKKFVNDAKIKYTIAMDPRAAKIGKGYKVEGFPTLYVIDKKGVVRYVHSGFPSSKEAQKKEIAEIAKEIKQLAEEK